MERFVSKGAREILADNADRIYNKLVRHATGRNLYDIATGNRKPDLKPKKVMVTMILSWGKDADPKAEQQQEQQAR